MKPLHAHSWLEFWFYGVYPGLVIFLMLIKLPADYRVEFKSFLRAMRVWRLLGVLGYRFEEISADEEESKEVGSLSDLIKHC
jgi:hypothetical protein